MSSPTNSPREPDDVDPTAAINPEENEKTSQDEDPKMDVPYDFEVKEQDRWLPIANGEYPHCASLATNPLVHVTPLPLFPLPLCAPERL